MIRFGLKLGFVSGTVYYISDAGVWRDSETSSKLYNNIKTNVSPYTQEITKQLPFQIPDLPKTNEFSYLTKYYWNRGVFATFNFFAQIPKYVTDLTNQGYNSIMNTSDVTNLFSKPPKS